MPTKSAIEIPWEDFPFEVRVSRVPLLSDGSDVVVIADLKRKPSRGVVQTLDANVEMFVALAELGALCGSEIAPWESGVKAGTRTEVTGNSVAWNFGSCLLDERALLVLLNAFLLEVGQVPLIALTVRKAESDENLVTLSAGDPPEPIYPQQYTELPFALHVDETSEGETYQFMVLFESEPDSEQSKAIEGWLLTWTGVTMNGLFACPPDLPKAPSLVADLEMNLNGRELEWSVHKFRAHPGAIHALVNVLAALHHEIAPIESVSID